MLHFIPKVKASYHSFEEIIRQAKTRVETLDEGAQNALKEKLNHGLGILLTDEAHDMYLVQSNTEKSIRPSYYKPLKQFLTEYG